MQASLLLVTAVAVAASAGLAVSLSRDGDVAISPLTVAISQPAPAAAPQIAAASSPAPATNSASATEPAVPGKPRGDPALLRADREARRAGGGERLRHVARRRSARPSRAIRSSSASSAAATLRRAAGARALLARLRRDRRSDRRRRHQQPRRRRRDRGEGGALRRARISRPKILLNDERTDLAILKIENGGEAFPVLQFGNSDELEVGDLVLAVGNPFGVGQTVTSGIVSAVARTNLGINDSGFFIQTDAAINPGNSGGALVDIDGALVGINTAIFSRSGGSIGIGFAIPSNMVRTVVAQAIAGSTSVARAWIGVVCQDVTPDIAASLGDRQPARRAGRACRRGLARRQGGAEGRRPDPQGRRPRHRRSAALRLPPGGRRHRQSGGARGLARRRDRAASASRRKRSRSSTRAT